MENPNVNKLLISWGGFYPIPHNQARLLILKNEVFTDGYKY